MPSLTLTEQDNNRSVKIQEGDQITIVLEESPTTGYRWAFEASEPRILLLQQDEFSPGGSGVGGGGKRTFSFITQHAGTIRLEFKLWRDWEGDSSIRRRFTVRNERAAWSSSHSRRTRRWPNNWGKVKKPR